MWDLKALGRLCKRYRRVAGMTQKQVAIMSGYSDKSVSAFETGRCNNAQLLCFYITVVKVPVEAIRGCRYGEKGNSKRKVNQRYNVNVDVRV